MAFTYSVHLNIEFHLQSSEHKDIITHMAKMVDEITVPMARASILWLIGEYSERVPKIAPDVLRKMAKSFITEVKNVFHESVYAYLSKLYETRWKFDIL